MIRPFVDDPASDATDQDLVRRIRAGSREALDALIRRHQPWIYNIVVRMLYHPHDSEDATQEILVKVITKLSTFEERSSFRTWLYRIVVNHVLNAQRDRWAYLDFTRYASILDATPDLELADETASADAQLLVDEARISCTTGMLLCLDRRQRLIYILGEIFGVTDVVGGELLEVSRDNFRQQLARARRDLHSFMQGKCGLVNASNPCRCAKKTRGFMAAGYVDAGDLRFARHHVSHVRQVAEKAYGELEELDVAYGEIYRHHPFYDAPDFVASLRALIDEPQFKTIMELT